MTRCCYVHFTGGKTDARADWAPAASQSLIQVPPWMQRPHKRQGRRQLSAGAGCGRASIPLYTSWRTRRSQPLRGSWGLGSPRRRGWTDCGCGLVAPCEATVPRRRVHQSLRPCWADRQQASGPAGEAAARGLESNSEEGTGAKGACMEGSWCWMSWASGPCPPLLHQGDCIPAALRPSFPSWRAGAPDSGAGRALR